MAKTKHMNVMRIQYQKQSCDIRIGKKSVENDSKCNTFVNNSNKYTQGSR